MKGNYKGFLNKLDSYNIDDLDGKVNEQKKILKLMKHLKLFFKFIYLFIYFFDFFDLVFFLKN